MLKIIIAALVALVATSAEASGAITVDQAIYRAGILIVKGQTSSAYRTVTLDGIYRVRSGSSRFFQFRVRYRPHNCVVRLRSGTDIFHAEVANCRRIR